MTIRKEATFPGERMVGPDEQASGEIGNTNFYGHEEKIDRKVE